MIRHPVLRLINRIGCAVFVLCVAAPLQGADLQRGMRLYSDYCAVCHGSDPRANRDGVLGGADPQKISRSISENNGGMAVLEFLSATDLDDIATYLQAFVTPQAESLTRSGAALAPLLIDPANAVIEKNIALHGGADSRTFVVVVVPGIGLFQRTEAGGFMPWLGDLGALIDNGYARDADSVRFDIVRGNLAFLPWPMTFFVGEQTAAGDFYFGFFQVQEQP